MDGQILLNGKRARMGRIFGMEIGDNVRSMSKFVGRQPRGFFIGTFIAKPPDQIKEFTDTASVIQFRVKNL